MNFAKASFSLLLSTLFLSCVWAQKPVSPNASPEAVALLDVFYRISGKYTLTGQHNYPNTRDRNSRFAAEYIGKTPAIWSSDMGFAKDGDTDSYLARPDIVKEAIRQHQKGALITLCWHAVPPTANEPVTFRPADYKPVDPDSLNTIQGRLAEWQYKELMTPGTPLHKHWEEQVDTIAFYLKQLQKAKVPVLWRPYHEMNGNWFWWGERVGEYSTIDLWKMLFDRLVNYHNLNNLIWVWNVDRPAIPIRQFSNFYPGNEYLDIVSLDVYGSDFNQAYYDSLMALSNGKPLYFGEVGNPPTLNVYQTQPNWTGWVIWAGMARNTSKEQYQKFVDSPRILFQEDEAYREVMNPYREACNLHILPLEYEMPNIFSGIWKLDNENSTKGSNRSNAADFIKAEQEANMLHLTKIFLSEWGDEQIFYEDIPLLPTKTMNNNSQPNCDTTSSFDIQNRTLQIVSRKNIKTDGKTIEMNREEIWKIDVNLEKLEITIRTNRLSREEKRENLIYYKETTANSNNN